MRAGVSGAASYQRRSYSRMHEKTTGESDLHGFCRIANRKGVFGAVSERSKKKWANQAAAKPYDCPAALGGDWGFLPCADGAYGRYAFRINTAQRDGDAPGTAIPPCDYSPSIADRALGQTGTEWRARPQHRTRVADLHLGVEGAPRERHSVYGRDL